VTGNNETHYTRYILGLDSNNRTQPRVIVSLRLRVSGDSQSTQKNTVLSIRNRGPVRELRL
jgi:hypothetical protein